MIARVEDPTRLQDRFQGLQIIGIGYQPARGVNGGTVVDMSAAETAIGHAVEAAERMAEERITSIYVNLTGGDPVSSRFRAEVPIDKGPVADDHVIDLSHQGPAEPLPDQCETVHLIPSHFAIDGYNGILDPRGMTGRQLGALVHMVSADSSPMYNLRQVIQRCHLKVERPVVSALASGLAVLTPDEMELGVTVIDLGAGATSLAVFLDGAMVYQAVIPLGCDLVTNDLARGLSTSITEAERLKTLCGSAIPTSIDDRETLDVPLVGDHAQGPQMNTVPRSALVRIIQPRLRQILKAVRASLDLAGTEKLAGGSAVITGGGAETTGVRELAHTILNRHCRVGRPPAIAGLSDLATGPAFATCAGLLRYGIDPSFAFAMSKRVVRTDGGGLGAVGRWLREHV